jgi:predicted pore-forming effector associated with SMODS systems
VPTSNWTRLVIALATLVSASIVLATGGQIDLNLARAVVTASTVVILFLLVFDRWLWRWPGIRRVTRRPVLHGTWKTELRTSYAARTDEVIEAYLVIRQTYSTICVDMLFDRSQSTSMSGDLVRENGRCILYYVFRSDKQTLERDENPPARGAAQLTVAARPSLHLEGDYWMEHGTQGRVATIGHSTVTYDTYSAAHRGGYR